MIDHQNHQSDLKRIGIYIQRFLDSKSVSKLDKLPLLSLQRSIGLVVAKDAKPDAVINCKSDMELIQTFNNNLKGQSLENTLEVIQQLVQQLVDTQRDDLELLDVIRSVLGRHMDVHIEEAIQEAIAKAYDNAYLVEKLVNIKYIQSLEVLRENVRQTIAYIKNKGL